MTEKEINIQFHEYSSLDELGKEDRELAEAAIDAMKGSYAPYSHFNVGAAIRLSNGMIVQGANQENAAFLPDCAQKGPQCSMQEPLIPIKPWYRSLSPAE